jgi:signal transduction histidine kinase
VADTSVFPRSKFDAAATVERTGKTDGAIWTEYIYRAAPVALLVALGYYAATEVGFALTPSVSPISALWPPNALLLAALLLVRRRFWWMLLLAVLPAHLMIQLHTGVPLPTALGWFVGNTGEALFGALCITHFRKRAPLFDSIRGVTVFLVFGVLLAPFVTSFLDAGVVLRAGWGTHFWMLWVRRLFSNTLAALPVAPAIVLASSRGLEWIRKAGRRQYVEAALLLLGTVLASFFAFGGEAGWRGNTPALAFVPLPFLLWACMRLGSGGLHGFLLVVALIGAWSAVHGRDPFNSGSIEGNILTVQILLCTIAVPLMLLCAFMTELRQSTAKVVAAQEEERTRIARELHDDIGQRLALVGIKLGGLQHNLPSSKAEITKDIAEAVELVQDLGSDVQALSHHLHSSKLEYLGLAAAAAGLCRDVSNQRGVEIDFHSENIPKDLPKEASLCLFRVLQEAIQNATKHSGSRHFEVSLSGGSSEVELTVRDFGIGFDPQEAIKGRGLGLTSIRERLKLVNGNLSIDSQPQHGTTIQARVPLTGMKSVGAAG